MFESFIKICLYMILILITSFNLYMAIDDDRFNLSRCISIVLTVYFMAGTIKMIGVM